MWYQCMVFEHTPHDTGSDQTRPIGDQLCPSIGVVVLITYLLSPTVVLPTQGNVPAPMRWPCAGHWPHISGTLGVAL